MIIIYTSVLEQFGFQEKRSYSCFPSSTIAAIMASILSSFLNFALIWTVQWGKCRNNIDFMMIFTSIFNFFTIFPRIRQILKHFYLYFFFAEFRQKVFVRHISSELLRQKNTENCKVQKNLFSKFTTDR